MKKYDYIILGGGCAGLSLAFYMKKKGISGKKVLILEAEKKERNDRSWCFWSDQESDYGFLLNKSWDRLSFGSEHFSYTEQLKNLSYHYIRGSEFYQVIKDYILDDSMFEYCQESVTKVSTQKNEVWVQTTHNTYIASWAFNSIPPNPPKTQQDIWLKQHFIGYFLETPEAVFDPTEVSFMDFSTDFPNAFMYVLPFSPTRALVEFTVFSEEIWDEHIYKDQIAKYLREKFQTTSFNIQEMEKGVIPMTSFQFPKRDSERVINIGTRGGMTKATTGYTFLNIQKDSQRIVDQLIRTGTPLYSNDRKKRYRFYDNLLLDIIKHEPEQLKRIMTVLFKRNKISRVLRFLDEKTALGTELLLLLRLPWLPFFRAIYRFYLHGKVIAITQPGRSLSQPAYPAPQPGGISPVD